MTRTAHSGYLRFPHLHGELVAFTAEDDVWVAPLDGGRAWRVSADNVPVSHPRISPDGTTVAWTSTRDGAPEVHIAPVDGGPSKRLTYWGSSRTQVRGWTPDGQVLALSTQGQASLRRSWARAVPLDGGPATTLPYGPVGDVGPGPAGRSSCCPRRWAARPPGGSATGAARPASCGSTGRATASSYACTRSSTGTSSTRCGWATGSPSCPTTKASAPCTPPSPTAVRSAPAHAGRRLLRPARGHRRHPCRVLLRR